MRCKCLSSAALLILSATAAAAPLERQGPFHPCQTCDDRETEEQDLYPVGWSLRARPVVGYYDFGGTFTTTLVQVNLPNNLGVLPCQPVLARFFSCSYTTDRSASGTILGADVGVDYNYKRWTFSIDFEYDNVSTSNQQQGQFDSTGFIPTVRYALSPNWDVYGGYEWHYKGSGILKSDYYLQSGELLGLQYNGFKLPPTWRVHLGGEFGMSNVSFYGVTKQFVDPSAEAVAFFTDIPNVRLSTNSIKLTLEIDSPHSPHSVGASFRELFTETGHGGFTAFYGSPPSRITAPATVEGNFHEYYAHFYYQYTFGKRR